MAVLSNLLRVGHDELLQVLFDNVYDIQGKTRIYIIRTDLLYYKNLVQTYYGFLFNVVR